MLRLPIIKDEAGIVVPLVVGAGAVSKIFDPPPNKPEPILFNEVKKVGTATCVGACVNACVGACVAACVGARVTACVNVCVGA